MSLAKKGAEQLCARLVVDFFAFPWSLFTYLTCSICVSSLRTVLTVYWLDSASTASAVCLLDAEYRHFTGS